MVARASEVPVVGRAFLPAIGLADGTVHVQNDLVHRLVLAQAIYPLARQVHQRVQVGRLRQDLRLKPAYLALRGSMAGLGSAAHNMSHCRIHATRDRSARPDDQHLRQLRRLDMGRQQER